MITQAFRGITYTIQIAKTDNAILFGSNTPDWFQALGGNNTLFGNEGNDVLLAGERLNLVVGVRPEGANSPLAQIATLPISSAGNNTIISGPGNDYIVTGSGNDFIDAGPGDDTIRDTGGSNLVIAGEGNNSILLLQGQTNQIYAGSGQDTVQVIGIANSVCEANLGEGNNIGFFSNFKNLIQTGSGDDDLTLSNDTGVVNAGGGNNRISMNGSNNTVTTGSGNDSLNIVGGVNVVDAGEGSNFITGGGGSLTARSGAGSDSFIVTAGTVRIDAGEGSNFISAEGADLFLTAGAGNDSINVRSANRATIRAGEGRNIIQLSGDVVADVFTGSDSDTFGLRPGQGVATLWGYGANDVIRTLGATDLATLQSGADVLVKSGEDVLAIVKNTLLGSVTVIPV